MSRITFGFATATMITFAAPAALADLTAQDVWDDWTGYINSFGYTVDADLSQQGGTLTLSDVGIAVTSQSDTGMTLTIPQIIMTEQGDGSVTIALPPSISMDMTLPTENGGSQTLTVEQVHDGLSMVATGTPAALSYAYDANSITLRTQPQDANGAAQASQSSNFEVVLEALSGTTETTLGGMRRQQQNMTAEALRYSVSAQDAASNAQVTIEGSANSLTYAGDAALPLRVMQAENMDQMLAAGMNVSGKFDFQSSSMNVETTSPEATVSQSSSSGAGTLIVDMAPSGLSYEMTQNDIVTEAVVAPFPFPLTAAIDSASGRIAFPVRSSDTPDDIALSFDFDGVTMSDMIWGMFDPTGQLPRDPATIALELSGKARLLADIFAPDAAALQSNPDAFPAEVDSLNIDRLQIKLAGAELTGEGAFDFKDAQLPATKPTGAVNLSLVGGNALIDRLVAIGLLPEDQAMGARMMMGLLAVPGDAPDTLNSKIEINEQGHISANGQRIQ